MRLPLFLRRAIVTLVAMMMFGVATALAICIPAVYTVPVSLRSGRLATQDSARGLPTHRNRSRGSG